MRDGPFKVSVRKLATFDADIKGPRQSLQELLEVVLFFSDVRSLASSNPKGEASMKRFAMAISLSVVLSASALAGEVPTVGVTAPPPPPSTSTVPGDIPSVGFAQEISDAAFDLVERVLNSVI